MSSNRREFLSNSAQLIISYTLLNSISSAADKKGTRLILLGTKGGPRLGLQGRKNPSTLLLINDTPYVIDCGYGTCRQLIAVGVPLEKVRYIFITHHHSDHNLEYGPLLYNAWIVGTTPIKVDAYGPPGLKQMTEDFFKYQQFDIETRIVDEGRPDPRGMVFPHDFDKPGVILVNDDVKVGTCLVRHPPVTQSYAYRFDAKDRSVVISGDTAYAPELAKFAKGADILVHEIIYPPGIEAMLKRVPNATRLREHLRATHTVPEDVGRVANDAEVKTLVLTHFVPGDDPTITDEQWTEGVRKYFKGRIIVGKDLMEI
jgi:ribonuclease BN (tRNA processing enzyme)